MHPLHWSWIPGLENDLRCPDYDLLIIIFAPVFICRILILLLSTVDIWCVGLWTWYSFGAIALWFCVGWFIWTGSCFWTSFLGRMVGLDGFALSSPMEIPSWLHDRPFARWIDSLSAFHCCVCRLVTRHWQLHYLVRQYLITDSYIRMRGGNMSCPTELSSISNGWVTWQKPAHDYATGSFESRRFLNAGNCQFSASKYGNMKTMNWHSSLPLALRPHIGLVSSALTVSRCHPSPSHSKALNFFLVSPSLFLISLLYFHHPQILRSRFSSHIQKSRKKKQPCRR